MRLLLSALVVACVSAACTVPARAQTPTFFGQADVEWHALESVRSFFDARHDELRGQGVPVAMVNALPPFRGGRLGLRLGGEARVQPLAEVGIGSTGGRLHYADYSGEVREDLRLRRVYVGLGLRSSRLPGPLPLHAEARLRHVWSVLHYDSFFRLGAEQQQEAIMLHARGLSVALDLAATRRVGALEAGLHAGIEFTPAMTWLPDALGHRFRLRGAPSDLFADWSGPRVGLSLAFAPGTRAARPD